MQQVFKLLFLCCVIKSSEETFSDPRSSNAVENRVFQMHVNTVVAVSV